MTGRPLHWGILSTADIGVAKVIPAIQRAARCEVVAIASRDASRAADAAARLAIPRAHGSYAALLADPEVDAIYNPLPNHLHEEWTLAAARAGKHVLCEKPLAMDAAGAERIVAGCREAGVLLMEAFMYRLHPSWVAVREAAADGRIGRVSAIQTWFSYRNDDPTNIRNIAAYGGGALLDIGCYAVNLSRLLFGGEPEVIGASVTRDPAMGVDVLASAILRFASGVATFTVSTRVETDQRVHVYGDRGRIEVPIPFNIPPDRPTELRIVAGGDPPVAPAIETRTFPPCDQYAVQAETFARAVLDGEPLPFAPEDAVANLRVLDAIVRIGG